jgi:hypothetical protein
MTDCWSCLHLEKRCGGFQYCLLGGGRRNVDANRGRCDSYAPEESRHAGRVPRSCPFCGGKPVYSGPTCNRNDDYDHRDRAFPLVRCSECWATVPGEDWDQDGLSAIIAWNRRPEESND